MHVTPSTPAQVGTPKHTFASSHLHHHHHHRPMPLRYLILLVIGVALVSFYMGAASQQVIEPAPLMLPSPRQHQVIGRGTFQGSPPLSNPSTRGVTVLAENEWLRLESHRVAAPSRRKQKGEHIIDDWWWVRVPDHVNVMVQITLETGRSFLATPREGLHVGLRGLKPTPAATELLRRSDSPPDANAGLFILMRQSKYSFDGGKVSWAVVGGLRNDTTDGEGLAQTAKRELLEELGLVSDDWVHFGDLRVDANRGCGTIGTFLAKNARPALQPHERKPPPTDDDADEDTGDLELQKPYLVTLSDVLRLISTPGEVLELKWTHTMARTWMHFSAHASP